MENDDRPVGQILSRRDALKLLGVGSAAFLAACASPRSIQYASPDRWVHAGIIGDKLGPGLCCASRNDDRALFCG